jgi:hypothetical protein
MEDRSSMISGTTCIDRHDDNQDNSINDRPSGVQRTNPRGTRFLSSIDQRCKPTRSGDRPAVPVLIGPALSGFQSPQA